MESFQTAASGLLHSVDGLGVGVRAAQFFEDLVLIVLDAQAYAVKPLVAQCLQQRGGDTVGIGFEGDLCVR